VTDWHAWHEGYDDPASPLTARLAVVVEQVRQAVAERPGPVRLLSACAGLGLDVVQALAGTPRADDVTGVLVELDPVLSARSRQLLLDAGLSGLRAVTADAGTTTPYAPGGADVLLLCGVFGNLSESDVERTVREASRLCAPGATVIWTRHRRAPDATPAIRQLLQEAGWLEQAFDSAGEGGYAVGVARLGVAPLPYLPDLPLFAFA
jgi:hypothetical protein